MRRKLELVVFDLAGTTVVDHGLVAGAAAAAAHARPADAAGRFERELLLRCAAPGAVAPVAGVGRLLEALHLRAIKVAIATPLPLAVVDAVLDRLGWLADGLVDVRAAGDEVEGRDALLGEAMRRALVDDPRRVASVGDSAGALAAADRAGCAWNVGVTWGRASRSELAAAPHTGLVDDAADLAGLLVSSARAAAVRRRGAAPWREAPSG